MARFRLLLAFLAVSFLLAAPLFGSVHAAVPHSHAPGTHLHTDLYESLVSVLHRDGAVLAILPSLFIAFTLFAALALFANVHLLSRDFALANALKEGRLAYRRFG